MVCMRKPALSYPRGVLSNLCVLATRNGVVLRLLTEARAARAAGDFERAQALSEDAARRALPDHLRLLLMVAMGVAGGVQIFLPGAERVEQALWLALAGRHDVGSFAFEECLRECRKVCGLLAAHAEHTT